ncbi:MAG: AAA family ATPase [Pirellulaceae bacterium]|nr:AAA family ATPase [Pirellulaceae bacterium]
MDVERIKMAARGREAELLEYVAHLPRGILDGKHHPCPKCGGKDRFRYDRAKGFVICNQCFASKNGDVLAAIQHFRGIDFPTTLAETTNRLGVEPMNGKHNGKHSPGKTARKESPTPPLPVSTSSNLAFEQLDLTDNPAVREKFVKNWAAAKAGLTAEQVSRANPQAGYWHRQGVLVFSGYRPSDWKTPTAVLLYRPDGTSFPAFQHLSARKTHLLRGSADSLLLVGTPDELRQSKAVWLCAGLPDAIAISPFLPPGHIAVTSACGEGSFAPELVDAFRDRIVYIVMDADSAGDDGARIRARALFGVASAVFVVKLPVPEWCNPEDIGKAPKDIRDFIAAGRWQDVIAAADEAERITEAPGDEQAVDNDHEGDAENKCGGFELKIHTSAELDEGDFAIKWFLENFFAVGQDGILAGGIKVLKTTIAVALAISIATGIPFLGIIRVLTTAPVLVLSGESGLSVLQETARRICLALGISLRGIGNLYWSDCLPRFDNPEHIAKLAESLEIIRGGLLIVDPAYLALPGDDAGNVFAQGEMLREISVLCRRADVTLLLLHHFSKTRTSCEIPELQDIAWSGFGEFARQWLLIGRREKYVPGTGEHKLWLSVGGSAGHNQMLAVDVNEGLRTDPGGRRWEVVASSADDARQDAKRQRELERAEKLARQDAEDCRRVLEAVRQFQDGETKSKIRDLASIEGKRVGKALMTLLKEMRIEQCEITKNGRRETGYRATGK